MGRQLTQELQGRRAAVAGAGRSGRAAAFLLSSLGARVRIVDKSLAQAPADFLERCRAEGFELMEGEHSPEQFANVDLVVMSPGIPAERIRPFLPGPDVEVVGELELASRYVLEPILAITGTNGKTTTATLCAGMLRQAGLRVFLGGNIGTPLAEHVLSGDPADVLVLETSSFQLQTCLDFKPQVAVLLNFSPNHLDYHRDEEEYLSAKLRLFARQGADDVAILPVELCARLRSRNLGHGRLVCYQTARRFDPGRLAGEHNLSNIEAAYLACREFGVDERQAQSAVREFEPLPHRLSRVTEKGGVLYVDDSKATTVDALRAALTSFDRPVRLLAGGIFKGGDLRSLVPLLRERVRSVGLFGGSREIFQEAWNGVLPLFWAPTLGEALEQLARDAEPGEVVLLSPATSSFDQYADYKARGRDFQQHVNGLDRC